MIINEKFSAIRKGLLEFLVLRIVAGDKVYVADILTQLSGTEFATQEGTLYPLLSKMRREELVDYEWKESEAGPPRKYYQLTAKGRDQLKETNDYWQQISETVKNLGKDPSPST
jgi:PadR family transcriptional regulator, regulatory protein PadR